MATAEELAAATPHPVAGSLAEAARGKDIVILANNHPALRHATFEGLTQQMHPEGIVFDYWNHFRHEGSVRSNPRYLVAGNMGVGAEA